MYLLLLLRRCFHVVEIARVSSLNNIMSDSTTTADIAVCIFYSNIQMLFAGSSIFSFRTKRIAGKVVV